MPGDIKIYNQSTLKFLPKTALIKMLNNLFGEQKVDLFSVNVIYLNDSEIQKINMQFLGHDYPTDVISFDLEGGKSLDGEIYIGVETAARQAEEYKVSLKNEILRLAVHGALHLVGYDDAGTEQRSEMHRLENIYINGY